MKIRPSLRLYFFISIALLGTGMTVGFSVLSVNYYIDGLDRGLNGVMHELVMTTDAQDGQPVDFADFQIASRWQDTPAIIQQRFRSPPTIENDLLKFKDQESFFSLPRNMFFVAMIRNAKGEPRYVTKVMLAKSDVQLKSKKHFSRFYWIIIIGLSVMTIFAGLLVVVMGKVAKPIESLGNWAKTLNHENVQLPPPDFIYNELNTLASIIKSSLDSAHQSLAREQTFLSYASHELRTPITVIRSNVELLKRLSEQSPLTSKQQLTLERIERAGLTMSDLTETLLWLGHKDDEPIHLEPVKLSEQIQNLSSELAYLLNGKNVEVDLEYQAYQFDTAATACHIVLSNLIRNAYQHTQHGRVQILQKGSCVTITNSSHIDDVKLTELQKDNSKSQLGYGLGLQLSEKIIQRHNWQYKIKDLPGFYQVKVDFNP
ncbi:HAMP domain-containing sensor histidine kinase [Paraglaciecola sp. L1A13]|uniref:sensor histidine kinase n=1 Tax=Paraglaciecola sp. L1A13 TaxID=2686359 RepID=UPI0018EF32AD|nr:HAMP domain-containing sensor histidine kinase [Paraglaciecola sp. L1A13]